MKSKVPSKTELKKNGWPKRSVDLERETSRESKRKPTSAGAHFLVHNKRLRNPRRLWRATTFSSRSDEIHRQVRAVQWKNQIGQRNAVVEFLRENGLGAQPSPTLTRRWAPARREKETKKNLLAR